MNDRPSKRITPWFLIIVFFLLVIGILSIGFFFYQGQQRHIETEAKNNLTAIADLKVDQIVQWRTVQMSNAELIYDDILFVKQAASYLNAPADGNRKQELLDALRSYQYHFQYESALLINAKGEVRLALSVHGDTVETNVHALVKEAFLLHKPIFSDLHFTDFSSSVHMDLVIPLLVVHRPDTTVIGALLFRIDPNRHLFPVLRRWPAPSRSSETLLLKHDGSDILYLNDLRHRQNTTARFRLPVANEELPASMAVRGKEGIVEGKDYRGVRVLAAIRKIPDTPWFMIAKVDRGEILASLQLQAWAMGLITFLFILSSGSIIGFWWRHQQTRFYREKYEDQLERQMLVKHFEYLIKYANDIILLIDMDGRIVEANDQACRTYEYTHEELHKLNIQDIRTPEGHHKIEKQMKQQRESGSGLVYEAEHRKKGGVKFPVEISSQFIRIDNAKYLQCIIRDITERKRAEKTLRENEAKLQEAQRIAGMGHYVLDISTGLWTSSKMLDEIFGITKNTVRNIECWESIIHPEDRNEMSRYLNDDVIRRRNPFNREYRIVRVNDGAVRWLHGLGNLEFGTEGQPLKMFGIIQDVTEKKRAEDTLRENEDRFRRIFEEGPLGMITSGPDFKFMKANTAFCRMTGYEEHELTSLTFKDITHPEDLVKDIEPIQKLFTGELSIYRVVKRYIRKDKAVVWGTSTISVVRDKHKRFLYFIAMIEDITEHKRAEEALRESEEHFRSLAERSPNMIFINCMGRVVFANKRCEEIMGYTKEEFYTRDFDIFNLTVPEYRDALRENFRRHQSGEEVPPLDYALVTRGGKRIETILSTKLIDYKNEKAILGIITDITDRKQTEEILRESEERYRRLFELSPDTIFIQSEGNIVFINDAGVRLFGATCKEDLIGRRIIDLMHPDYRKIVAERMDQLNNLRQPVPMIEEKYLRMDGTPVDVEVIANSYLFEGKPAAQVVVRDITERKRAEEALLQSESLFKTLVEFSPVSIAVFSGQNQSIDYVSHRFTELFGYEQSDLPTLSSWWPLAYPMEEYRNQIDAAWRVSTEYSQRERTEPEPLESVITCKDGSTKYIESTLISMSDHTLIFFSDLTQRRMAEEALRQTHAFNDLLIQTMPFGMNIVDEEGNILFVSKTMKEMLTVDVVDMCCWKVYKDDNEQCSECPLKRGIPFGKPEVIETTGVLGGKTFQISHVGMMYEGRKALLEVFQDVTEQKKLQHELIQSQKMLSIGTLAGGIAHDFNNILAIILGYISILSTKKDDPKRFSEGVHAIKQAVDRGAGLVKQILTFASKTDVMFEPTSVPDLTRELVSMMQQTFPKTVTFNQDFEAELPVINADHSQIHQVLLNLCVNARDAMPKGGVISIKAGVAAGEKLLERFPAATEQQYLYIAVSDTGTGIDETTRTRIFDPFFTTKEKGKGTGLGLSVVYGVLQAHHGFIDVESEMGKGTTFRLYLPVQKDTNTEVDSGARKEQVIGGNETLLVVEDEDLLLDMIQILLEAHGYTILSAKDGNEAITTYAEHAGSIALVMSDMGLPKLSGEGVYYKIKEINPAVKMIVASGFFEPDTKATLEAAGVLGFLQKPYIIEDVLAKIRKALDT
ncbi:MAG: PAS domain S-box protein [Ignavibacteriae bacterium]|nr:MAG: PAS domain S-box protein [Ignavibacteriota bacterium]